MRVLCSGLEGNNRLRDEARQYPVHQERVLAEDALGEPVSCGEAPVKGYWLNGTNGTDGMNQGESNQIKPLRREKCPKIGLWVKKCCFPLAFWRGCGIFTE